MSQPLLADYWSAAEDLTITDLFARQAQARPAAIAVSSGTVHISYGELDELSDQIAAWLVKQNVGLEDVVAVEMERGLHLIAALIGILKAGGVYLALELDAPRFRRNRLIGDAGVRALITSDSQLERSGIPTLRLPQELERLPQRGFFVSRQTPPESLAYICYTSGSTGQPKGVAVPHRAVVRLAAGDYAELGSNHTFLFLSPISFDASTFEIWAPLLTGGRVVVYPSGPLAADQLAAVIQEQQVTTLFLTTALFHRVVDHNSDALRGVQQLLTGGEVLSPGHFNRTMDCFRELRLVAAYGPTENTTFTTCHSVAGPIGTNWVPLGRPIAGTTIHVLDSQLEPVPDGSNGELCIGGSGLSRGYVGQPVATALSFVPDPFGEPGSRIYRSGDIVRRAPGGDLEFIGRSDRQVKIRGFRVEPAEIEREIAAITGVEEVVVATQFDHLNEKRLTAYLVPNSNEDDPEELVSRIRRRLRETLPPVMIPAALITLDQFPLTPNGKIDRASLPVPERTARQTDTEFVAPRSDTEQMLCDLWAESLKLHTVGVLDDFFELGGNSLLAMDLISRTETVFDVDLPIRALLYHPTIEEFAGTIDELVGIRSVEA